VIGLILFGQNHLYVKMLFYKGFHYSEVFQKILHRLQVRIFLVPCRSSGRSCHPVRTLICPLFHPSGRRAIPSGCPDRPSIIRSDNIDFHPDPSLHREASVPACIRPDISAARPDASQYSTKLQILSKFIMGRLMQPSERRGFPSKRASHSNSTIRTPVCHRPDACAPDMKIAYSTSTVRTPAYHVLDGRTTDMEIGC
jgi:hypothetical protein